MTETETPQRADVRTGEVADCYGCARETVCRWMVRGVMVHGRRVLLRSVRVGQQRRTSWEWVAEFRAECDRDLPPTAAVSPAQAQQQAEKERDEVLARLRNPRRAKT